MKKQILVQGITLILAVLLVGSFLGGFSSPQGSSSPLSLDPVSQDISVLSADLDQWVLSESVWVEQEFDRSFPKYADFWFDGWIGARVSLMNPLDSQVFDWANMYDAGLSTCQITIDTGSISGGSTRSHLHFKIFVGHEGILYYDIFCRDFKNGGGYDAPSTLSADYTYTDDNIDAEGYIHVKLDFYAYKNVHCYNNFTIWALESDSWEQMESSQDNSLTNTDTDFHRIYVDRLYVVPRTRDADFRTETLISENPESSLKRLTIPMNGYPNGENDKLSVDYPSHWSYSHASVADLDVTDTGTKITIDDIPLGVTFLDIFWIADDLIANRVGDLIFSTSFEDDYWVDEFDSFTGEVAENQRVAHGSQSIYFESDGTTNDKWVLPDEMFNDYSAYYTLSFQVYALATETIYIKLPSGSVSLSVTEADAWIPISATYIFHSANPDTYYLYSTAGEFYIDNFQVLEHGLAVGEGSNRSYDATQYYNPELVNDGWSGYAYRMGSYSLMPYVGELSFWSDEFALPRADLGDTTYISTVTQLDGFFHVQPFYNETCNRVLIWFNEDGSYSGTTGQVNSQWLVYEASAATPSDVTFSRINDDSFYFAVDGGTGDDWTYNLYVDDVLISEGVVSDTVVQSNITFGTHDLIVEPVYLLYPDLVSGTIVQAAWGNYYYPALYSYFAQNYTGSYEITTPTSGVMELRIYVDGGKYLDYRNFNVYTNQTGSWALQHSDLFELDDTTKTVNVSVYDKFNTLLNTTIFDYARVVDIFVDTSNVKVQNLENYPVWVEWKVDSTTAYSEWILSTGAWAEWDLYAASYNLTVHYSQPLANSTVGLNGSSVIYSLDLSAGEDIAIRFNGTLLDDILSNLRSNNASITSLVVSLDSDVYTLSGTVDEMETDVTNIKYAVQSGYVDPPPDVNPLLGFIIWLVQNMGLVFLIIFLSFFALYQWSGKRAANRRARKLKGTILG